MLGPITGEEIDEQPRTLYWQHENHAAVRRGDWKLIATDDRDPGTWELYNLGEDRSESEELSDRHPDVVERLKETWLRWARQANVLPFPETRGSVKPIPWPPRPVDQGHPAAGP